MRKREAVKRYLDPRVGFGVTYVILIVSAIGRFLLLSPIRLARKMLHTDLFTRFLAFCKLLIIRW